MGYEDYPNGDELYNPVNDPEELENLIASRPRVSAELQGELEKKLEEVNEPYRKG